VDVSLLSGTLKVATWLFFGGFFMDGDPLAICGFGLLWIK
jgi:hypothetical protein